MIKTLAMLGFLCAGAIAARGSTVFDEFLGTVSGASFDTPPPALASIGAGDTFQLTFDVDTVTNKVENLDADFISKGIDLSYPGIDTAWTWTSDSSPYEYRFDFNLPGLSPYAMLFWFRTKTPGVVTNGAPPTIDVSQFTFLHEVDIYFNTGDGGPPTINIPLVNTPEPSTLGFTALGVLGIFLFRKANRLRLAAFFLTLAGAPFAAGSVVTFEIVNSSMNPAGGVFNSGGNYYGTFSFDTSLIPSQVDTASTLSAVDITTTASGASEGDHYTAGQFALEAMFTDPTSNVQYDSDHIAFFSGFIPFFEITLIEKHGTFVGGQISDVSEIEPGVPGPSIRLDTSGKALLVDRALATPEPATWSYLILGVAAIAVSRARRRAKVSGEAITSPRRGISPILSITSRMHTPPVARAGVKMGPDVTSS
jgi:PEP-CTERM motif-containing protein